MIHIILQRHWINENYGLQIKNMQRIVANIESDAARWFHETAYRIYKPSTNDFVHALHKVLYLLTTVT